MAGLNQMNGFHSTFRSFGDGRFAPIDWQRYFLAYNVSEWLKEGDGVIQFLADDNKRYSLTIIHVPNRGFVLQYDCRSLDLQMTLFCKYAVSNRMQLSHFEEVGDGLVYPTGCIVLPSIAWNAVNDFLNVPTRSSENLDWVDDQDISWPEL